MSIVSILVVALLCFWSNPAEGRGEVDLYHVFTGNEAQAKAAYNRLINKEDIATVAMELSECVSKYRGGSLGHISEGELLEEFDQVLWTPDRQQFEDGTVFGPLSTALGFHVLYVKNHAPRYNPKYWGNTEAVN
eukprot:PhF_6_TR4288/c0_g1_i1/m.5789/K03769/ppiC; peptidyl-prolyl cis-trans isomerase C